MPRIGLCIAGTALLLWLLAPWSAGAFSATTGNHLLRYAREWKKNEEGRRAAAEEVGFYFGYVWALAERLYFSGRTGIPKDVSRDKLERIVFQYLQSHPSELHYPAAILIENAFRQAFSR